MNLCCTRVFQTGRQSTGVPNPKLSRFRAARMASLVVANARHTNTPPNPTLGCTSPLRSSQSETVVQKLQTSAFRNVPPLAPCTYYLGYISLRVLLGARPPPPPPLVNLLGALGGRLSRALVQAAPNFAAVHARVELPRTPGLGRQPQRSGRSTPPDAGRDPGQLLVENGVVFRVDVPTARWGFV